MIIARARGGMQRGRLLGMVFTRRFWWLLAGGIVLGLLGTLSPGYLSLMCIYDAALIGAAVAGFLLGPKRESFLAERIHDPVLSVRSDNLVRLRLSHLGRAPMQVTVRDEPPAEIPSDRREFSVRLQPGRAEEVRYHLRPQNRGAFEFREVFLRVPTPLGLVDRIVKLPINEAISVYPNVLALRKYNLLKHRGHLREMGIRRASLKGVGSEFESLKEYTVGDEVRRVDWKASAKRGKLMVREYEAERSQSVLLAIDLGRLMMAEVDGIRKFDHVIDAALMLANAAVQAQDRVGLLVYHDQVVRFMPPRKGRAQIGAMLEALHGLEPEPVESNARRAFNYLARRWRKRSLIVAFTDLIEPEASRQMTTALLSLRNRHLCLAATVSDPKLDLIASRTVSSPTNMYQRAVALEVQEDRKQVIRELELGGIHVVDAEPQNLAQALINYYTHIKARGMI
jgi:uncharacterized protein (DUF58 family)